MPALKEVPKRRVLHSWKEVAAFLGATVRSVQRWEKVAGLPVHRQGGGLTTRIYAYSDELEVWRESGPASNAAPAAVRKFHWIYLAAGLVVAIAAVLILMRGAIFPGARLPAIWRLERSTLTVMDSAGRLCWMKQFPAFDSSFESEVRDKVLIADIDGDGRPEVLFNYLPSNLGDAGGTLLCFEPSGRLRWQFRYGAPKTFGARSFSASYRGQFLRPVLIEGRRRLLTVANHYLWYPSQTALLDPKTGRLEEEYWHPGAIHHCALADLHGYGRQEVLLGGINNPGDGLGHASLAVLSLPFSKAPRPPPADFPALTGGGEMAYLLFPLPDVLRVAGVLPILSRLDVDQQHHILVETPLPENGGAVYHLNSDLNVLEVRFSDNFALLHRRFNLSRLLDHSLSENELASLRQPMHFSAAPDGNSPQVRQLWKY